MKNKKSLKENKIRKIIKEELKKHYKMLLENDVSSVYDLSGKSLEGLISASESISSVSSVIDDMILVMQKSDKIDDPESVKYLSAVSKDVSSIMTKLSKLREDFASMQSKLKKFSSQGENISADNPLSSFSPETESEEVKLNDPKHGQEILNDENN